MLRQSQENLSVTVSSAVIMPRVGPREELFERLKEGNFDCVIKLEEGVSTLLAVICNMLKSCGRRRNALKTRQKRLAKNSSLAKVLTHRCVLQSVAENFLRHARNEAVKSLLSIRYLHERVPVPSCSNWLLTVLPQYSDDRFKRFARMSRREFGHVLHLLQTRAGRFFETPRKQKQLPLSVQLHLALYLLGHYGNAAGFPEVTALHGYSEGMVFKARQRVCRAVCSLGASFITWPNADERRELAKRVHDEFGFEWAFFLVDGTTHPFAIVPSYNRTNWYDRKSRYSLQALVSCDIDLRVRHLVVGWPGSSHDARVLRSADYMIPGKESEYFTGNEHGLGDAAFGLHRRVLPNYKEPLASFPENREYNLKHSSLRVLSEHCIGHVKSRFQGLREIRMRLRRKEDLEDICNFIMAGYILHNVLLEFSISEGRHYARGSPDGFECEVGSSDRAGDSSDEEAQSNLDVYEDEDGADFREVVKHQVLRFHGYE